MGRHPVLFVTFILTAYYFTGGIVQCCNESVCSKIVTKCQLLLRTCMCYSDDFECQKTCYDCLGLQSYECCPCLDFCPNKEKESSLNSQSQVETFPEATPGLFQVLTDNADDFDRWVVVTAPIQVDISHYGPRSENIKFYVRQRDKEYHSIVVTDPNVFTVNCTAVFLNDCVSVNKCRKHCLSMGANGYRWFHDGCCQCFGERCVYHGFNESSCLKCPIKEGANYDITSNEDDYEGLGDYDDKLDNENDLKKVEEGEYYDD